MLIDPKRFWFAPLARKSAAVAWLTGWWPSREPLGLSRAPHPSTYHIGQPVLTLGQVTSKTRSEGVGSRA
jgi:hypothetical protein